MLRFNFKVSQIACSVYTAADFFTILELKVKKNIRLKIREDVQTTPIEVTTSSSGLEDEERVFFTQAIVEDQTEKQIFQRKELSRKKATERVANEEPSSVKPKIEETTEIDGNTTPYSMN